MKSLSIKQVLQILKIASESKRNHAMILLAFQHGMRASEICGLKLDASDFVFTSQKGGRVDRTQFFRIFQAVAERAGIPMDLRHPHCGRGIDGCGLHAEMADKARQSAMANLF